MKSFLTLCLVGLLTISSLLGAHIPDEINYAQLDQLLQELDSRRLVLESEREDILNDLRFAQDRLRAIEVDLAQEEVELDRIYSREREILRDQDQTREQIERNSRELRALSDERNSRERSRDQLARELGQAKRQERDFIPRVQRQATKVAAIKNDRDELARTLSQLDSELSKLTQELAVINQKIQQLDRENTDSSREIESLERKIREYRSRQNTLAREIREVKQKISSIEMQIVRLEKDIAKETTVVETLGKEVRQLEISVEENNKKVMELRRELLRLQRMSRRDYPREAALKRDIEKLERIGSQLKQKLTSKKREASQANSSLKVLVRKKEKKSEELSTAMKEYQELLDLSRNLPSLIAELENKITALERLIVANTREKTNQLSLKSRKERERQSVAQNAAEKRRQLEGVNNLLTREERELAELNRSLQSIVQAIQGLGNRIEENEQRIRYIARRLQELDQIVEVDRRRMREMESELERNARLMSQINRRISQLQDEANFQAREVRTIETVLASKDREVQILVRDISDARQERAARFSLYQRYESQAMQIGQEVAREISNPAGENLGDADARLKGEQNGIFFGEKIGLLSGFINGLKVGADRGKVEGLRDGRADDASYQQGYLAGVELGVANAKREANEIVYPKSYRAFRNSLQQKSNSGLVATNNLSASSVEVSSTSDRSAQSIDELIQQKEAQLRELNSPRTKLSKAEYAYSTPNVDIPRSPRSCLDVYRGYVGFVEACENAFTYAYQDNFVTAYGRVFRRDYESYYAPEFQRAFDQNKNRENAKGEREGYDLAYAEYFAKGAGEVYQQGKEKGQQDGYQDNIAELSKLARQKAKGDAKKHYDNHALVWVGSADKITLTTDAPNNELRSGASVRLQVSIKNSGGRDLVARAGRIRLVNLSPNLEATTEWFEIPKVARGEIISFSELSFKISKNSRPGELINFSVELESPGDDVDPKLIERVNISKRLKVNPQVSVSLDYNTETRWRKWKIWPFKWEWRKESVGVNLQGINENVPGKYKVVLEQIGRPKVIRTGGGNYISSPSIGRISSGAVSYEVTKKVRKTTVKLKLSVYYESELVKERELSIYLK